MSSTPTPGIPERNPNDIRVEVFQPEYIYQAAVELGKSQRNLGHLNETGMNDQFLRTTTTDIYSWGVQNTNGYYYNSWFHLSPTKMKERADFGYYGEDRIRTLQQMLRDYGYEVEQQDQNYGDTDVTAHSLYIKYGNNEYKLSLGLGSREAHEEFINQTVKIERARNNAQLGYYEEFELPKIADGLTKDAINFSNQTNRLKILPTDPDTYDDEATFIQRLLDYAKVYQDLLNILYDEAGIPKPINRVITLTPPLLESDTLAQIAQAESLSIAVANDVIEKMPTFEDIAGQPEAVKAARRLVAMINHPEILAKRGIVKPKGILFYGPPGTGKTMIGRAIAREANAVFLSIAASDIHNKYFGESERLMKRVFEVADKAVASGHKVILFFDEIDALAKNRDAAWEGSKAVVATLLQNIDGLSSNPDVTIIATSNRPQDIDVALKRPGRLDELIYVGLPNAEGREKILGVHISHAMQRSTDPTSLFSPNIDPATIAEITEGMSGADLAGLINQTLNEKAMDELEGKRWTPITTDELIANAKKQGYKKEEKRRIGFAVGENGTKSNGTNGTAVTSIKE